MHTRNRRRTTAGMRTLSAAMLVMTYAALAGAQAQSSLADVEITDAEIASLARGLAAERQALQRGRARLAKDRPAYEAALRKHQAQQKGHEAYMAALMKYSDCMMGDGKALKDGMELAAAAFKALEDPEMQQITATIMALPPAQRAAWMKRDSLRKQRAAAARTSGDLSKAGALDEESKRDFEKTTGISAAHMEKVSKQLGLDDAKAARVEASMAATEAKCGAQPAEVEGPEDVPKPEEQMLEEVRLAGARAAGMAESDYAELLARLSGIGNQPLTGRFQPLAPYRGELKSSRDRGWQF